jgi:hypothetical protein
MKNRFLLIGMIGLLAAIGLWAGSVVHATNADPQLLPVPETLPAALDVIEPEKDTCFQCHLAGSFPGLFTPVLRWLFFGSAGIILLFGLARSASVWHTREPWIPIPARMYNWLDDRYRIKEFLKPVLSKPVPDWQRRWWYCLGGLTFTFFLVQGATGIMLAFYYKPTPEQAYASIQFIESEVRLGSAVRMIHHWSANGMIVMAFAHMLRVFITGAYKPPRELNWISGVLLLTATLAFGFTGYLLPWDQRAFWATTVGTEIAGSIPVIGDLALVLLRAGWNITDLTLSRFFAAHVLVLPLVTLTAMGAHFIMIRRQGLKKPL